MPRHNGNTRAAPAVPRRWFRRQAKRRGELEAWKMARQRQNRLEKQWPGVKHKPLKLGKKSAAG